MFALNVILERFTAVVVFISNFSLLVPFVIALCNCGNIMVKLSSHSSPYDSSIKKRHDHLPLLSTLENVFSWSHTAPTWCGNAPSSHRIRCSVSILNERISVTRRGITSIDSVTTSLLKVHTELYISHGNMHCHSMLRWYRNFNLVVSNER